MAPALSLSVLDQSPVRQGGTAAQALRETVELAKATERFGYKRYWVAEHHNAANFAGTTPEILIGQIAANTTRIRVGSGGVMLSHYSALKVAETFRVLSAFYPGRIDLGIGRAPGSDQRTAVALADPKPIADINQFPRQVADLVGFLTQRLPEDHPFAGISAQPGPAPANVPEIWLLGSSDYSAQLAAAMGLPFAFADFFGNAGDYGPRIVDLYREDFQPSEYLSEPKLNVAVHVTCAETEQRAHFIASSMKLLVAQRRTGHGRSPLIPPEEASRLIADARADQFVASFTRHYVEGTPEQVRSRLQILADRYGTDELIIVTNCYSFADRVRSYELIAQSVNEHQVIAPRDVKD
ncbi:MAG TPA: LLM class flavin-dependent oxidoreductase [Chloroflexota bacterium]|nr:LLM class flavin-dependent oxidoreductase [Chloroflexota bacterium]